MKKQEKFNINKQNGIKKESKIYNHFKNNNNNKKQKLFYKDKKLNKINLFNKFKNKIKLFNRKTPIRSLLNKISQNNNNFAKLWKNKHYKFQSESKRK